MTGHRWLSAALRARPIRTAAAVAAATLVAVEVPAQPVVPPAPGVLVIRHATVIDPGAGQRLEDQAIVIRRGVIQAVGPGQPPGVADEARILDVDGRPVLPGLIDLHQHEATVSEAPSRWLAHGVTSIRDPGASLDRARWTRARIADGWLRGPRMFLGLLLELDAGETRASVRHLIASHAAQDIDLVKLYMRTPAAQAKVAIDEAHARGLPVTWHLSVPWSLALELGADGVEHLYVFRELLPEWSGPPPATTGAAFHAVYTRWARHLDPRAEGAQRLLRRAAAREMVWTPTLLLGKRIADGASDLSRHWTADQVAGARAGFEAACRMVGEAHRVGVPIGAGTDTGHPADLHAELELLVRCGLSPGAALGAATRVAATAVGHGARLGAIAPGKLADLIVLDADPLTDIRATSRIWRVVQGGHVHDPETLR